MANVSRPAGLSPIGYLNGADWDGKVNMYYIASTDGNAFYIGDPVTLSGSGHATLGIPGVTIGSAGGTCLGAIVACGAVPDSGPYIDPSNLSLLSIPATKTKHYYVAVADDPQIVFEMEEGGAGTVLAATNIGQNANFVAAAPGTGVNVSAYVINNASVNTTSTLNLKLLGLVRRPDNAFGAYSKWRVLINNHTFRTGVTGV